MLSINCNLMLFALCDMNAYYCSNEMIFRPDLIGQPVVALSNNDGAIVSITPEAKALGIKKFAPYFQQKDLIEQHNVAVFSSNYVNYGYVSERIMKTLAEHAAIHEVYSIDEIFCDVTKVGDPKAFALYIRKKIYREHRIPMGVGISFTKTLSKLANHTAKKINQLKEQVVSYFCSILMAMAKVC